MLKSILLVPKDIQIAVLNKYLKCCMELGRIAFYEWRLYYVSYLHNNNDKLEILIKNRFRSKPAANPEITQEAALPPNFLVDYKFNQQITECYITKLS